MNSLRDLTSFTNKSFDFEDVLNKIVRICDEDNSYGDDIVFNNRDYYTRIANRYGDLLKQFEKYLQNWPILYFCYEITNLILQALL